MSFKLFIQLIRIEQWIKNLFIFLPIFFNGQLLNISLLLQCIIAFFAFSFAASSIYCFNDICDVEADRQHPKKCKRPIASGAISIKMAYVLMAICFAFSMFILSLLGGPAKFSVMGLIVLYYLMNIAYSLKLKHYAIIDVIIISIGFVLRILVGGSVIEIWTSEWIIIMTFLLALFLAFGKRADDVLFYQNTGIATSKNTIGYNLNFINLVMTIISTTTIIAYIMYTLSPDVIERFNSRNIYITSAFVLIGIIRYKQITMVFKKSGNPTTVLLEDRFIQFCIAAWFLSFLIIIYL